jgi:hypothetical protein
MRKTSVSPRPLRSTKTSQRPSGAQLADEPVGRLDVLAVGAGREARRLAAARPPQIELAARTRRGEDDLAAVGREAREPLGGLGVGGHERLGARVRVIDGDAPQRVAVQPAAPARRGKGHRLAVGGPGRRHVEHLLLLARVGQGAHAQAALVDEHQAAARAAALDDHEGSARRHHGFGRRLAELARMPQRRATRAGEHGKNGETHGQRA